MTPENLMKTVAAAYCVSDFRPLLDSIDDNIVWRAAHRDNGVFRFGGTYAGRVGVMLVTSQIASTYFYRRLDPEEIVSVGDVVWGRFRAEMDYLLAPEGRAAEDPFKFDFAARWVVRNGKIVEHRGYFDTAALLVYQGGFASRPSSSRPN